MKRRLAAVGLFIFAAVFCRAQNTSTFGTITAQSSTCTPRSCVYYQVPQGMAWVSLTVAGTWSGTIQVSTISGPDATYQNINNQTWSLISTVTANENQSIAVGTARLIIVNASVLASGSAQITLTSSASGTPLSNPVFSQTVRASGVQAPDGGTSSKVWATDGSQQTGGGGGAPAGPTFSVQFNNGAAFGGGGFLTDAAGDAIATDFLMGAKTNVALIAEGESVPAGSTLITTASTTNTNPLTPPVNVGVTGNQDLLSRIALQPQFNGRYGYLSNFAVQRTTCAQMVANYTTNSVANWAPGGSSAPAATSTLDFIMTGKNDQLANTTLAAFQSCMNGHLQVITALGITPVLITEYATTTTNDIQQELLQSYNTYIRNLKGQTLNGQIIHVIDVDGAFPPTMNDDNFIVPVNQSLTTWDVPSFQITQSGTAPNQTSTVTATFNGPGILSFLDGTNPVGTFANLQCGGFTGPGSILNYQYGTYVSGTPSNTIVFSLAAPLASTGTITDNGFCYSVLEEPGLHMGANGYEHVAEYLNSVWGISGLSAQPWTQLSRDYYHSPSGAFWIGDSQFCNVSGLTTQSPTQQLVTISNCGILHGDIYTSETPAQNVPTASGWHGGHAVVYFGDKFHYLWATEGSTVLQTPIYSQLAGSLGYVNITTQGTGYAIGDQGTIGGAGANTATFTIMGIVLNGACNYNFVGYGAGTGPACLATINSGQGGQGYINTTGVATTATTGSGSGMVVSTIIGVSSPLTINSAGVDVAGGSVRACAAGVPCTAPDTLGYLVSVSGGAMSTVSIGNPGSGYAVPGPTTIAIAGSNGTTGTVSATGANGVVSTTALTTCGSVCGLGYTIATWPTTGGTGTGATIRITQIFPNGAFCNVVGIMPNGCYQVASGGSGYTVGDVLTVVESGASGGVINVTGTANGGITSITLSAAGTAYVPTAAFVNGNATSGGTGTGFTVNVVTVTAGAGRMTLGTGFMFDSGTGVVWNPSGAVALNQTFTTNTYKTTTNCGANGTAASPSLVACTSAAAGSFSCSATASGGTCIVSTTAVTTNSQILVELANYIGTRLAVTCNTTPTSIPLSWVASVVNGTSFTINMPAVTTNPACFTYHIVN